MGGYDNRQEVQAATIRGRHRHRHRRGFELRPQRNHSARHNASQRSPRRQSLRLRRRVQLQQILLNLIMNSIEAMKATSDLPRILTVSSELTPTGGMLMTVEDTGAGLDPAIADRIFEGLFTTKANGWAWDFRSAVQSLRLMADRYGPHPVPRREQSFNSSCRRSTRWNCRWTWQAIPPAPR